MLGSYESAARLKSRGVNGSEAATLPSTFTSGKVLVLPEFLEDANKEQMRVPATPRPRPVDLRIERKSSEDSV